MSNAYLLRVLAAGYFFLGVGGVVIGTAARGEWPSSSTWSNAFLIAGAIVVCAAPYVWGLANGRDQQRSNRFLWMLSAALHGGVGVAAVAGAVANVRDDWLGGVAWTIALLLVAAFALLGLSGDLTRLARPNR